MKRFINTSLQKQEIRQGRNIIDIEKIPFFDDQLDCAILTSLAPLKAYVNLLMQAEEDDRIIATLDAIIENTEQRITSLLDEVRNCIGKVHVSRAVFDSRLSIKGGTTICVALEPID